MRRRRRRRLVVDNYRFAAAVAFVLEKGGFRGKGMSSSLIRRGATGFDFGEQREAEGALGGRRRVPFCICRRWLVFFFWSAGGGWLCLRAAGCVLVSRAEAHRDP